jgi:pimeloyl-ACP methyl ester carboxylesterase
MTASQPQPSARRTTVTSADGTRIGVTTLGAGAPVIVVGGAMRTARDYLPLACVLARHFQVHVVDRRGRGASGPQGEDHTMQEECQDLLAVQQQVGATAVFGHSFGGLVVLETAQQSDTFTKIAVYEPGMSLHGSLPVAWMPRYRELLARGDTRSAFAHFVQRSGHAPAAAERMPLWYLAAVMRIVVRGERWRRLEPLLGTNLREHELALQARDSLDRYSVLTAPVLLLGGADSPAFSTRPLHELHARLPRSTLEIVPGLDHNAPDEKAPETVAERLQPFLQDD